MYDIDYSIGVIIFEGLSSDIYPELYLQLETKRRFMTGNKENQSLDTKNVISKSQSLQVINYK